MSTDAEQVLELALRLHRSRRLVAELKRQRRALQCERGPPNPTGTQSTPCWKYTVEVDVGVGIELEPTGGAEPSGWCARCQKRQQIHERYAVEKPACGDLKRAFWRRLTKLDTEAARLAAKE